jgi:hypothetical protein
MAKDYQDNEEVKTIMTLAENTNRKVKEESTLASTAAELAIVWCAQALNTRLQSRIEVYQNNTQEAMKDTIEAAQRARDAFDQFKEANLEELISILAAEPEINELINALKVEEAELVNQIATIDAEVAEINAALDALDVNVTVLYADSTTDDQILADEAEIERIETSSRLW